MKGLVLDQWLGIFAPAGTPPDIANRLNSEINKAIADPAVRKNLARIRRKSRSVEQAINSPPWCARTTRRSDGW